MNPYLENLRQSPDFQLLLSDIKHQRPSVPMHDPNDDNTEIWKTQCGLRQGFDLAMSLFGENYE